MKVQRENFLQMLESVQAGLSNSGTDQGKCFFFQKNKVMTFSEECFVRRKIPLDLEAVIEADPLLKVLKKLSDETIDVSVEEKQFFVRVYGINKSGDEFLKKETCLPLLHLVSIPFELIEKPGDWKPLHEDFGEAIATVSQCTSKSKNDQEWMLTCVHIHPKWIESADHYHACRFRILTSFDNKTLIRLQAIKGVIDLGMTEFSETGSWVHFRNPAGVRYSCRKHLAEYPQLTEHFRFEGQSLLLPKDMQPAIECAEVFVKGEESCLVQVELQKNKIWIRGISESGKGEHKERRKIQYDGPDLCFFISPKMLCNLSKRFSEGVVTETKLKFDTGSYKLLCYLMKKKGK